MLVTQASQRCCLAEELTLIPVSVLKPPAAARYPTSRDGVLMCVHVFALIHSCLCVTNVCVSFSLCVCLRASSSHIPLGWSQRFGGDPAAWTIECVRNVRETREEKEKVSKAGFSRNAWYSATHKKKKKPPCNTGSWRQFPPVVHSEITLYISHSCCLPLTHIQVYTPIEDSQLRTQRMSFGNFFLIPVFQPALVFIWSRKPLPGRHDYTGAQRWT